MRAVLLVKVGPLVIFLISFPTNMFISGLELGLAIKKLFFSKSH